MDMANQFKVGDVLVLKHKPEVVVKLTEQTETELGEEAFRVQLLFLLDVQPQGSRLPLSVIQDSFRHITEADKVLYGEFKSRSKV